MFNVIGAGGTVAMARLMNERGNGDLMMMMGLGVVGAVFTNGSTARASDATALAKMVEEQEGILVPADSPFRTVQDFVAAWKADPAKITIGGGSSPGGPDHLFPMETAKAAGVDPTKVNYVSYDGGGDLLTALLGNKIAAGTSGLGEYVDQIESGQVRVLAVSGDERVEGVDAPTLTQAGIDLTFTNWRGVLAPPGISDEDKQAMVKVLEELHATDAWKEALVKNGWSDAFMTGPAFESFLKEQDTPGRDDADGSGAGMSTDADTSAITETPERPDYAQYLVCAVMVAVGAFLVYDAVSLPGGYAKVDPVGPRFFPIIIGVGLLVMAVVLAIAIPRGFKGEADAGEDIDPDMPSDWRTVGLLVGVFVLLIVLVDSAGLGDRQRTVLRRLAQPFWAAGTTCATSRSVRCWRWPVSTRSTPGSESRCPQASWMGFCRWRTSTGSCRGSPRPPPR